MGGRRIAGAVIATALMLPAAAGTASPPPGPPPRTLVFTDPVAVAPPPAEAWEPAMLADDHGNIFMHARRTTTQLAVAPDERSPTATRSSSWLWYSADGGATFENLEGLPLDAQNHVWGYEGDFALDDAGHLYFVDQTYADATISRWTVQGRGSFRFDFHRPLLPTGQPVDDRPWLAARGDGSVFVIVNAGAADLQPTGRDGGDAYGPGRFTVYRSGDGAATFEPIGHALRESGACRPAAARGTDRHVYIACTNDGGAVGILDEVQDVGTLWMFASADDGMTYTRTKIGEYDAIHDTFDWPLVATAPDGTVWVLHVDTGDVETGSDGSETVVSNTLNLYRSNDRGRTWTHRDVTPSYGRYRWPWLTVSDEGLLGLAVQHRSDSSEPWQASAAIFAPGEHPTLYPMDDTPVSAATNAQPPSEIMGIAFLPGGGLGVAWTRVETANGLNSRQVYFARTVEEPKAPTPPKKKPVVAGVKDALPATGVGSGPIVVLAAAALALTVWLRRGSAGIRPPASKHR